MKKLLFAATSLLILFAGACSKTNDNDQVLVRFFNATDSAIEEASMDFDAQNMIPIGSIGAGETTYYLAFNYFEIGYYPGGDYHHPTGSLIGKIDGVDFSAWSGNWCGTGVEYKQLEPGKYTIEIRKVGTDTTGFYQIKFVD